MAEIKDITKFHIFSSAYFASAVNRSQYVTDGKKEIAFIGRSNVGKSSLINSLTGRKKLAYVSREPGKTRTINYYAPATASQRPARKTKTAGPPSLTNI